jgi:hypothetical protein
MKIIENIVELSDYEKNIIDKEILGNSFSWYSQDQQTVHDPSYHYPGTMSVCNSHFLTHVLMRRSDNATQTGEIIDYGTYKFFHQIFRRWCESNNVQVNSIYRACVNFTVSAPADHAIPHYDHDWPHSNWIMYLNTVPGTDTIFFDDDFNLVHEVPCVKNTAVSFERQLHAHRYTQENYRRIVVVFTYV